MCPCGPPTSASCTRRPPSVHRVNQKDDASGAGRTPQPPNPPPPGPSFARRHPFYAAFGVLAALSLFSAFWPFSAFVTGAVVAARATGLDKLTWRGAKRAAGWLGSRIARRKAPGPPTPAQGEPVAPERGTPEGPLAAERSHPALRTPARPIREAVSRRPRRERQPAGAGAREPDIGPGL
jgi:hypothetical protein